MTTEDKNELDDRFSDLSMSELLDVLALKATPKKMREQIKVFICENYEHTTQFKFLQAVKEIEKMELTEFHKNYLMNVKICARDIIQALDFENIGYLPDMKKIILQKIEAAKIMS